MCWGAAVTGTRYGSAMDGAVTAVTYCAGGNSAVAIGVWAPNAGSAGCPSG